MVGVTTRPRSDAALSSSPALVFVLVGLRLVVLVLAVVRFHDISIDEPSLLRFHELGRSPGKPWIDHQVEFPPGYYLVIQAVAADDLASTSARVAITAVASELLTAWILLWGWGRDASVRYLMIGAPLLAIISMRLDGVAVALAVGGVALTRRDRNRSGGIVVAAAVLTRLWPAIVMPMFLSMRRWRALAWAAGAGLASIVAWVAWAGPGAVSQVLGFRGATGWEVGSTVGSLVQLSTRAPVISESGALRVGSVPLWAYPALATVLALLLFAIWQRGTHRSFDPAGAPAAASVAALLFLAPIFSDAYVAWLLPWAAIASADERRGAVGNRIGALATVAGLLTLADRFLGGSALVSLTRDVAVGLIVFVWFAGTQPVRDAHEETSPPSSSRRSGAG